MKLNFGTQESLNEHAIESVTPKKKIVFHRTSKIKAKKILDGGFRKSSKGFYGTGVYTVENLESTLTSYAKRHYGNSIVKCEISYEGYLEFIRFKDSVDALAFSKKNNPPGMVYTNKNDGDVVYIRDREKVTPIEYSVNGGKDWRSPE